MDGDRSTARDALRAASASLAEGITRLRVASAVCGGGAPPEVGESFVTARAGEGTPLLPSGASLRGQLSQFLPGGLGLSGVARERGSSGEHTILPSDHGSVGGSFQILNGFETRVNTPLTDGERGGSFGRQPGETRTGGSGSLNSSVFGLGAFSSRPPRGLADDDDSNEDYDIARGGFLAKGPQGQFPDRFCLKRKCQFTSHAAKSSLGHLHPGHTMPRRMTPTPTQSSASRRRLRLWLGGGCF